MKFHDDGVKGKGKLNLLPNKDQTNCNVIAMNTTNQKPNKKKVCLLLRDHTCK